MNIKKLILLLLVMSLVFASINVYASEGSDASEQKENNLIKAVFTTLNETVGKILNELIDKFNDLDSHWAKEFIALLYNNKVIGGYPDGTFRPDDPITRAEFTKILVTSLHEDVGNYKEGHWATNYLNLALEKGYVLEGEFHDLDKNITRGEMARMIVRALDEDYPGDIEDYTAQIADYNDIPKEFRDFVLKAYVKGIITGYPDGTFKYNQTATRAEASTMMVRFLEAEKRQIPVLNKESGEDIEEEVVLKGDNFEFKEGVLYYIDKNGNKIDTMTNSTLMTREELNWYFKTMYQFAKDNDLYFNIDFSKDSSTTDIYAALNKSNWQEYHKRAYIKISFTNNGNIPGMDKIGKNIAIITDNLTDKDNYLNKVDVTPYLTVAKKVIKYFTGEKYTEEIYKDFEEFQLLKSNSTPSDDGFGPIDGGIYTINKVKILKGSPMGYMVDYSLYIK